MQCNIVKYIYNMCNWDLPDIYTIALGLRYIYQANPSCPCYNLYIYIYIYIYISIKTHDSESRGQEEAGRMRRMSVLYTSNTAVKFVNALNKPPLKLSLNYQCLSKF